MDRGQPTATLVELKFMLNEIDKVRLLILDSCSDSSELWGVDEDLMKPIRRLHKIIRWKEEGIKDGNCG